MKTNNYKNNPSTVQGREKDRKEVLRLGEEMTANELLNKLDNILKGPAGKTIILGLSSFMTRLDAPERAAIAARLAKGKDKFVLEDFPFSLEALASYVAMMNFFNLPRLDQEQPIFQYQPPEGYSVDERNRRAAQKRKQLAEFDKNNRRASERIVQLKAQRYPETKISDILKDEGFLAPGGKPFKQGSINRLYRRFMKMYSNFRHLDYRAAGPANGDSTYEKANPDPLVTNKSEPIIILNSDDLKVTNEILTFEFASDRIPEKDFYLVFTSNNEDNVEDTLFINRHYLDQDKLSINILKQTILSPGSYIVHFCYCPKDYINNSFATITCDIRADFIEVDKVRFLFNEDDALIPIYDPSKILTE